MSFWKFCEKISGFVGEDLTITYINVVRIKWRNNNTVDEAVKAIQESEGNRE